MATSVQANKDNSWRSAWLTFPFCPDYFGCAGGLGFGFCAVPPLAGPHCRINRSQGIRSASEAWFRHSGTRWIPIVCILGELEIFSWNCIQTGEGLRNDECVQMLSHSVCVSIEYLNIRIYKQEARYADRRRLRYFCFVLEWIKFCCVQAEWFVLPLLMGP